MSELCRIVVLVTKDELKQIKQDAGDVPLSRWIKKRIVKAQPGNGASDGTENTDAQDVHGIPESGDAGRRSGAARGTLRGSRGKSKRAYGGSARDVHEDVQVEPAAKRECPHGVKKGWRCSLCGEVV